MSHLILSRQSRTLSLYAATGALLLKGEARNRTVNDAAPVNERSAPCPPGEFLLGQPVLKDTPPFGPYYIPIRDYQGHDALAANHRSGIGIHGGGSGLPHWEAPAQGWRPTRGCWRLQNSLLEELVKHVRAAMPCYVTVLNTDLPTELDLVWDEAPDVALAEDE